MEEGRGGKKNSRCCGKHQHSQSSLCPQEQKSLFYPVQRIFISIRERIALSEMSPTALSETPPPRPPAGPVPVGERGGGCTDMPKKCLKLETPLRGPAYSQFGLKRSEALFRNPICDHFQPSSVPPWRQMYCCTGRDQSLAWLVPVTRHLCRNVADLGGARKAFSLYLSIYTCIYMSFSLSKALGNWEYYEEVILSHLKPVTDQSRRASD